jgi:hypothetical protein
MILINPDEASSILDQHLSSIERHLMLIKCDLESLQLKIVAGDVGTETQANKTIGRINHWVRSAIQTEMKIAEQKKQKPGLDVEDMGSTLMKNGIRSGADWIVCANALTRQKFLNEMTEGELLALPYLFEFWAMEHQLPPQGAG